MESSTIIMTEDSTRIRNYLTEEGAEHFDDIYFKRKLGATPNIRSISHMYMDVAQHAFENGLTSRDVIDRILDITSFFELLRGDSSYAITAAMKILTQGLKDYLERPVEETSSHIISINIAYEKESSGWTRQIQEYGYQVIRDKKSMLLYDYSSLAGAIIDEAAKHGHIMELYVPESRFLDGGLPFVRDGIRNGHRVHFFPDAAMMYFMKLADVALMGAETFFPNGDMVNTIGSELVAMACKRYEKPLYIPTSLIKMDNRAIQGMGRKLLYRDLKGKLASHWPEELSAQVDFVCPNLDTAPAEMITGYITEKGVIPPGALFGECRTYLTELAEKLSTGAEGEEKG